MMSFKHIVDLKPGDPGLIKFVSDTLIPGLLCYITEKERKTDFVSFFHSLGLSAGFVAGLSVSDKGLKNALDIAVETCILRLLNTRSNIKDVNANINYLKSLFNRDESAGSPDSIIVFKPSDISDSELKSAVDNELNKIKENTN
jgi:hypothetical protein